MEDHMLQKLLKNLPPEYLNAFAKKFQRMQVLKPVVDSTKIPSLDEALLLLGKATYHRDLFLEAQRILEKGQFRTFVFMPPTLKAYRDNCDKAVETCLKMVHAIMGEQEKNVGKRAEASAAANPELSEGLAG